MINTPSFLDNALRRSLWVVSFWFIVFLARELVGLVFKTGGHMQMKERIFGFTFLAIWGAVIGFCGTKPIQLNKAFSVQLVLLAVVASALLAFLGTSVSAPSDVNMLTVVAVVALLGGIVSALGQYRPMWKNRLETVNPQLAAEWHPTKNWGVTPRDVKATWMRKVWWKCPNGHVWRAEINSRQKGSGCPVCKTQT